MKLRYTIFSLFLLLSMSTIIKGQSDDLRIFGYFQNNFTHLTVELKGYGTSWMENSFDFQQMNIFLAKNFGSELSSFVNLEFTNSFSLQDSIGGFKVEEAWLKYSPSSAFNFKAGLMIPRFNYLNEIKNKTAILPYIYRPLVYETMFANQFAIADFVPQQAYLQVYGDLKLGEDTRVNYAAFMGNTDVSNLVTNKTGISIGHDSSHYKMVGGRLGFESGSLNLGVSGTYDKKNLWSYGLGYLPRMRFGAWLNYALAGFELESEYIRVYYKFSQEDWATLQTYNMANFMSAVQGFNKYYFHVNLLYNITNQLYAYAGYDYLTTEDNIFSAGGLKQPTVGGGYRLNESILLKAQYTHQASPFLGLDVNRNDYIIGASIYF